AAPHVGDDVDDGAAVFGHALVVHLTGHQEATDQVGAHHRFEPFLVDGRQRRGVLAASVVDQAMDPTVLGNNGLDHFLDLVFFADVADKGRGFAAIFLDFAKNLFQLFQLASDQDHLGAEGRQFMGGTAADAATAAGDDDGLVLEQSIFQNRLI